MHQGGHKTSSRSLPQRHNEISNTAKNLQILNPKSSIGNKRTSNIKICTGKTTNRWEYYHLADLGFILVLGQI
jgi:hypothetical protein